MDVCIKQKSNKHYSIVQFPPLTGKGAKSIFIYGNSCLQHPVEYGTYENISLFSLEYESLCQRLIM